MTTPGVTWCRFGGRTQARTTGLDAAEVLKPVGISNTRSCVPLFEGPGFQRLLSRAVGRAVWCRAQSGEGFRVSDWPDDPHPV